MRHFLMIALNDGSFLVGGVILGWLYGATVQRRMIADIIGVKERLGMDAEQCISWIKTHLGLK